MNYNLESILVRNECFQGVSRAILSLKNTHTQFRTMWLSFKKILNNIFPLDF